MSKALRVLPKYFRAAIPKAMSTVSTDSGDEVQVQVKKGKGVMTLNRPKALNSLNLPMLRRMYPTLVEWEESMEMVVMKGSGEKAFCAGGDVRAIAIAARKGDMTLPRDFFSTEYKLNSLIGTLHIPYVSFLDGITMGGGVGVSVHGYFRVATERTLFAMPETAIGFFPDVGGSYFLPRLGGNLGTFLGLTGFRLKGRDVMRAGIATHLCHSSRLEALEDDLIALSSPTALHVQEVLNRYTKESTFDAKQPFVLEPHLEKIKHHFGHSTVEEIISSLESDSSEWTQSTLKGLRGMSPVSLKVTLKALQEGSEKSLQECLQMEFRIAMQFSREHDLYEGVRALLIDKDQKPSWKPSTLEGVTPEHLKKFFAPLPPAEELQL